jgi:hypothetical protein
MLVKALLGLFPKVNIQNDLRLKIWLILEVKKGQNGYLKPALTRDYKNKFRKTNFYALECANVIVMGENI